MKIGRTILQRTIMDKEPNLYPVWLMRQAGRYMPEYMAIKNASKGFLDMALTPDKAAEITMQPIKEFDMDAAIIFSDILIIPYALGQPLDYTPGPKLGTFDKKYFDTEMDVFIEKCKPVYEAITKVRSQLCHSKSLIGFAGAPWTLYRYMSGNVLAGNIDEFDGAYMMARLVDYIVEHLSQQIKAGCDTVQVFDSWASDLGEEHIIPYCYEPTAQIVERLRALHPDVGIIVFPRLIGEEINNFSKYVNADCISLSDDMKTDWILKRMGSQCLQGGIPPQVLLSERKEEIIRGTVPMIRQMKDCAYVVNLAHGINKETPVENVRFFIEIVKRNRENITRET
jgi:uroporphyrinogen decarboxylase